MRTRGILRWFRNRIHNYNLFIPDDDVCNDTDAEINDPVLIKHQRYATRLYIPLLIVTLHILFFVAFLIPQTRIITISHITPARFNQLYLEHGGTLPCPCTTTNVPYNVFVTNTVSFHPVCSSAFIEKEWIEALHLPYASQYLTMDFRATASSQFELLAALCSISQVTVSQALADLNDNQLITIEVLREDEIQSQINGKVELTKSSIPLQVTSPLDFLQIATRANFLSSALNTNILIQIVKNSLQQRSMFVGPTYYFTRSISNTDALYSSSCSMKSAIVPAGFYLLPCYDNPMIHMFWPEHPPYFRPNASVMIDGFFGGCTPLDAILASTLDCLYNTSCLEHFNTYFPGLNQINLTWTDGLLSSSRQNKSLKDHLTNLLVDDWITQIDYSKYIENCDPKSCTYQERDQTNLSYTITLLLSLYGGLTIILRVVAVFLVNTASKLQTTHADTEEHHMTYIQKFDQWLEQLNMFKSASNRTATDIKQQRITTYIYLFVLTGSILILLLFTSLRTQAITMTVTNPRINIYKNLPKSPVNTLECPCLNVSIPYNIFTSLSPRLHQVCSSDLISDSWIYLLQYLDSTFNLGNPMIWRGLGTKHFQLLATICQLANRTINDAIHRFYTQSFITSKLLTESEFDAQLDSTLTQLQQSLITYFSTLIDMAHLFTQVDQPYTTFDNAELIIGTMINETDNQQVLQLNFNLTGIENMNSSQTDCICATDPYCQSPVVVYQWSRMWNNDSDDNIPYLPPGMIMGCFTIDSLLLSSLECYYLDSCLAVQYYYINVTLSVMNTAVPFFYIHPLIDNPKVTRFSPNTSLSTIVKEMMIEEWNAVSSFDLYYGACKPSYCVYTYSTRSFSLIELLIKLVSTIGGLTVALRLIIPELVTIGFGLLTSKKNNNEQNHVNLYDRIKAICHKLIIFIYTTSINLNLFSARGFGSKISRMNAKHLGQIATRLYIILLIVGFVILALYTVIQPQILSNTIVNPSLSTYNRLVRTHSDTLECPCSSISSTYGRFIEITPVFHEICSSPFALYEWQIAITAGLISDLSAYDVRDYRRFLSAHLQFLSGLCSLSIQSVSDSVQQFLASFFITTQLLSQDTFYQRINLLIEQSKSTAPDTFTRLLSILRATTHGNAIVSAYGTNFEYIVPWYNSSNTISVTQAITYDDNCSCASEPNCTSQAGFMGSNSWEFFQIKGLKMGCTPSESFLASTLECFYDISCINLIQEQTNSNNLNDTENTSTSLSADTSRFAINTTIIQLVQNLFIEKWATTINYSAYFHQCAPQLCSYNYIQELNSLYTITILLGLCGGLTVVLKKICPNILYLLAKVHRYWRKRQRLVAPASIIVSTNQSLESGDVNQMGVESTLSSTNLFSTLMFGTIIGIILSILMAVAVIVASIYLNQHANNYAIVANYPTVTVANTTTETTTTASVLTTTTCQLTFQSINTYDTGPNSQPASVAVGDFNNDNYLDLALANYGTSNVGIFLGQSNGMFSIQKTFSTGNGSNPTSIAVGDFNNDNHLDLVIVALGTVNVLILLGNGDGTFSTPQVLSIEQIPVSVTASDLNMDGNLDIVVANEKSLNIGILFGNGDGTFEVERIFSVGSPGYPNTIAVADLNNDGSLDLAISNGILRNVAILFNSGDGSFDVSVTLSLPEFSDLTSIVIDDFNSDNQLDLAVADVGTNNIDVILGHNNGDFDKQMTFSTGAYSYPNSLVVGDFNNDNQLDLAVTNSYTRDVGILIGLGNGTFLPQIKFSIGISSDPLFSTGVRGMLMSFATGDFNQDGKLDMVTADGMLNRVGILLNTCDCCMAEF